MAIQHIQGIGNISQIYFTMEMLCVYVQHFFILVFQGFTENILGYALLISILENSIVYFTALNKQNKGKLQELCVTPIVDPNMRLTEHSMNPYGWYLHRICTVKARNVLDQSLYIFPVKAFISVMLWAILLALVTWIFIWHSLGFQFRPLSLISSSVVEVNH